MNTASAKVTGSYDDLIPYGLDEEQADYRIHVSFGTGAVYVFPTASALAECATGGHPKKPAFQPGVEGATAYGYTVPPSAIEGCRRIPIPEHLMEIVRRTASPDDPTDKKGRLATQLVARMFREGLIALPMRTAEVTDRKQQIDGIDLLVACAAKTQIKCDFNAGEGGTGRLYLQVAERNPRKLH